MIRKKLLLSTIVPTIIFSTTICFGAAYADEAPVVNAYQNNNSSQVVGSNGNINSSGSNSAGFNQPSAAVNTQMYQTPMTVHERLRQLEAQIANEQQMNLPAQIQQLQQDIQQLRGQVQIQAHELKQLQQKSSQGSNTSNGTNNSSDTQVNTDNTLTQNNQINTNVAATTVATTPAAIVVSPSAANPNSFLADQDAYQAAYNLIAAKKYSEAITTLNNYIKNYPNGIYVANGHYWLGELYLLQNNEKAAEVEFKTVVQQYPSSNKLQDAMLKLGFIYYDNGKFEQSKIELQKVIAKYPNTTVAQLAKDR